MALRLEACGGTFEAGDGAVGFRIPWFSVVHRASLSLWLVEGAFHLFLPLAVWFQTRDVILTLTFGGIAVALLAVVSVNGISIGRTRRRARRALEEAMTASAAPERALVGAAISPVLHHLEQAVEGNDAVTARETVENLATVLEDLLWALEVRREGPEVQLALKDLSLRLEVPAEPLEPENTRQALYGARRRIRERALGRVNARARAGSPPEPHPSAS